MEQLCIYILRINVCLVYLLAYSENRGQWHSAAQYLGTSKRLEKCKFARKAPQTDKLDWGQMQARWLLYIIPNFHGVTLRLLLCTILSLCAFCYCCSVQAHSRRDVHRKSLGGLAASQWLPSRLATPSSKQLNFSFRPFVVFPRRRHLLRYKSMTSYRVPPRCQVDLKRGTVWLSPHM